VKASEYFAGRSAKVLIS